MPSANYLDVDVPCPACGAKICSYARFQWGMVPYRQGYKIGDPVVWMRLPNNEIAPPFTIYQLDDGNYSGWNSGDPAFQDSIVLDIDIVNSEGIRCPRCDHFFPAIAVVVQLGKFRKVMVMDDAEMDRIFGIAKGRADIAVIRADGTYWPRGDWYDHVLEVVSNKKEL